MYLHKEVLVQREVSSSAAAKQALPRRTHVEAAAQEHGLASVKPWQPSYVSGRLAQASAVNACHCALELADITHLHARPDAAVAHDN